MYPISFSHNSSNVSAVSISISSSVFTISYFLNALYKYLVSPLFAEYLCSFVRCSNEVIVRPIYHFPLGKGIL